MNLGAMNLAAMNLASRLIRMQLLEVQIVASASSRLKSGVGSAQSRTIVPIVSQAIGTIALLSKPQN